MASARPRFDFAAGQPVTSSRLSRYTQVVAGQSLTLQLPDLLAEKLRSAHQDFLLEVLERGLRELRIERVLALYARGGVTLGAAAEQAGVSQSELARHAYAHGLEPPFSSETLSEELG